MLEAGEAGSWSVGQCTTLCLGKGHSQPPSCCFDVVIALNFRNPVSISILRINGHKSNLN